MERVFKTVIFVFCIIFGQVYAQQFSFPILVADDTNLDITLTIGMDPDATDGFDSGIDILAPPAPPSSGAFDARLRHNGEDFIKDYRGVTSDPVTYRILYQKSSQASEITLTWDADMVSSLGVMEFRSILDGETILDLSSTNTFTIDYTDAALTFGMDIYVDPDDDNSLPVSLLNFSAQGIAEGVILNWSTASELQNFGFEVYRAQKRFDTFRLIAGYSTHEGLRGAGTTNARNDYEFADKSAKTGEGYWYRLVDVSYSGERFYHAPVFVIAGKSGVVPEKMELFQNFPNPFNPVTTIHFALPAEMKVQLAVYDLVGKKVAEVLSGRLPAGQHQVTFEANNLPSGVYFYQLQGANVTHTRRMILVQ